MLRSTPEEKTKVSTYEIDTDGIVRGWTPAAERLFGLSAEDMLGRSITAVTPEAPLSGQSISVLETEARRADGSRLRVALSITQTAFDRLLCRAWEVAEQRTADVLCADLALREFAHDAVVTADRAGHVIQLNPAAEKLFGCTRSAALGRPLAVVLGDEELPARVLAGETIHDERHRAGRLTLVNAMPLRDKDGEIAGATAIFSDVTAERGAAAARERQERDARTLEQASRALAESLDLEATLGSAVAAFVPDLADVCIIYSLESEGTLKVRAAVTGDPVLAAATARIRGTERPVGARFERSVVNGVLPFVHGLVAARTLAGNESEVELGALFGDAWRTALPLRSHDGMWGIMRLLNRAEPDHADLRLMQELAERAGQALENARVHALASKARERFTAAFENAPIGMAIADASDGVVLEANPALCTITGRTREGLVGVALSDVYHPGQPESGERKHVRADGRVVWLQVGVAPLHGRQVVLQIQDITERKHYEHQLQYLADHDPLTGLYNRRRFAEELDWILAYSRRYRTPAALVAIDIDNFKFVNDTFGHATGDELLVAIAEALRARTRDSDIAGRLGGDEFGVILPQSGREEADVVAHAMLEEVRDHVRVMVGEGEVRATASIGVRLIEPDTSETAEEILSDADIALYDAKEGGRDRMSVAGLGSSVTDRLRARISWSDRIREALKHDGFELFEQPILHIASDRAERSELLLRMRDRDGGMIAPGLFLDTAERFGQIQAIDRWVIGRAVQLLAERQAAGLGLGIEVNLSGGSISDPSVIDFIVSEVRNAPIDPTGLTIEVTETAAITNIERARMLAQSLADLGCRFALDDFGSGFGSFYYLKHLPFDVVKIDGEFIKELDASHPDRLTVQAIVQIARGLSKPTIAEFVESEAILRVLAELGVDYAQGYHIGRPRPVLADPGFGARA